MRTCMLNAHCAKVVLGTIAIVGRRKLCYAFQMRNKLQKMSRTNRKTPGSIYRSHPSLVRKNHLAK